MGEGLWKEGVGAGEESEGRDFVIILIFEEAIIRSKFNN